MRNFFVGLVGFVGTLGVLSAAPPYIPKPPITLPPYRFMGPGRDAGPNLDVAFLAADQPLKIRLILAAKEGTLGHDLTTCFQDFFTYFDRDKDGFLNDKELDLMPGKREMHGLLHGGYFYRSPSETLTVAKLDLDLDGKISFDEMLAFYWPTTMQFVRAYAGLNDMIIGGFDANFLFEYLDTNGDGQLDMQETAVIADRLSMLDIDEDELITYTDLQGLIAQNYARQSAQSSSMLSIRPRTEPLQTTLQVQPSDALPETLTETLLRRYDTNGDQKLTASEIGLSETMFRRLDRNGNGSLSATELDRWRTIAAEVTITIAIDRTSGAGTIDLHGLTPETARKLGIHLQTIDSSQVYLTIGRQRLIIQRSVQSGASAASFVNPFADFFTQADSARKGFLTAKEVVGPQFQLLRIVFDPADTDGDGKLTAKEFNNFFAMQARFMQFGFHVNYGTQIPSFYTMLDENGDGRLSLRELRSAGDRLRKIQGKDVITRDLMQPHGTILISRLDQMSGGVRGGVVPIPVPRGTEDRPSNGPIWFRKMDRNNDGDVSRSEFLGPPELFDKFDTDGDGLLSRAEAESIKRE